ncbi:MAG TPA: hypothetical protein VFA98_13225 [Thermoanaerobaculia bacterium]|jgi:hypothetical protein|nr:hypothetical protein [Thermoanaerobaculia bacterium]
MTFKHRGSKEARTDTLSIKRGKDMTDEEAREALADVLSMCCKVLHDDETAGVVQEYDLKQLQHSIKEIFEVVYVRGYKVFGGRIEKGGAAWRKPV